MEKINTELYDTMHGDKINARMIYCNHCDSCDFYQKKQCMMVHSYNGCPYSKIEVAKGYSTKAKKYQEFVQRYENDELYHHLNEIPKGIRFAVIGEYAFLDCTYLAIQREENRNIIKEIEFFGMAGSLIPLEELTIDFLNELLSYHFTGFVINNCKEYTAIYRKEIVPDFLTQLQDRLPELYQDLTAKYPKYQMEKTYIGRLAYISTLTEGSILTIGNKFQKISYEFRDGKLTGTLASHLIPTYGISQYDRNGMETQPQQMATLVIEVTPDMVYQITDNQQVNEHTKFV